MGALGSLPKFNTSAGTSTTTTAPVPTPQLTGLPQIDAMIKQLAAGITLQGITANKSLLQQQKALQQQRKAGKGEMALMQAQLAASQVAPPPVAQGINSPEVEQARRAQAMDAATRLGMRKSIMAGPVSTTPMTTRSLIASP